MRGSANSITWLPFARSGARWLNYFDVFERGAWSGNTPTGGALELGGAGVAEGGPEFVAGAGGAGAGGGGAAEGGTGVLALGAAGAGGGGGNGESTGAGCARDPLFNVSSMLCVYLVQSLA
jgi:hypothetical protein